MSEILSWKESLKIPSESMHQFTDEEMEEHMEAMYKKMKKELKEASLQKEAIELKPIVFSDHCPSPADPYAYYPMSVVTHAYNMGIISSWDIVNYRQWRKKSFKARRATNISMNQAVQKMRIDMQIRNYFSKV